MVELRLSYTEATRLNSIQESKVAFFATRVKAKAAPDPGCFTAEANLTYCGSSESASSSSHAEVKVAQRSG